MTAPTGRTDLACFSYLAHAQILHVDAYPAADHGAEVTRRVTSLAADGPLTAACAARQGLRTTLVANQAGTDPEGQQLRRLLEHAAVRHEATGPAPAATPHMTVVAAGTTRTWFVDLSHAYTSLCTTDTRPLGRARLAYIDCYRVLTHHAAAAIQAAAAGGVPLLLNLGGDPVADPIRDAARHATVWAVQTSLPAEHHARAHDQAAALLDALRPHTAVVTLGAQGALALTRTGQHRATAPSTPVLHTHGAGAAFSAGLITAHLNARPLPEALQHACHTGTTHCSNPPPGSTPPRVPAPAEPEGHRP